MDKKFDFIKVGAKVYFGGNNEFPEGTYVVNDIMLNDRQTMDDIDRDTVILIEGENEDDLVVVFADEILEES